MSNRLPDPAYNAWKVVAQFRYGTSTYDYGTQAVERLYVGQTVEFAVADLLAIIAADDSTDVADLRVLTVEPRLVEQ